MARKKRRKSRKSSKHPSKATVNHAFKVLRSACK